MTIEDIQEIQTYLSKVNQGYKPLELKFAYHTFQNEGTYYGSLYFNWGEDNENFHVIMKSRHSVDIYSGIEGWFGALEAVKSYNEDFGALDFEKFRNLKNAEEVD